MLEGGTNKVEERKRTKSQEASDGTVLTLSLVVVSQRRLSSTGMPE